jgi:hypothetical protein
MIRQKMMNTRSSLGLFLGILLASAVAYAGGYSEPTRKAFMQDCTQGANEKECLCVLDKLQNQYSEKAFSNYYSGMRKGAGDADFLTFMVSAATGCVLTSGDEGELFNAASTELSEEDIKLLFDTIKQQMPKKDFVQGCAPEAKDVIGDKMAREVCGCAYDRMVADYDSFVKMVKEEGMPGTSDKWGADYVIECVPEKFTPEVEQHLIKYLNQQGIPLSTSQCLLNVLKKEYTLRAFIAASVKNSESFQLILMGLVTKCMDTVY